MVYRPGNALRWEGHSVDWRIVEDADEEEAAIAEGWQLSPDALDHDGDGRKGGAPRKRRKAKVKDEEE